MSAEVEGLSGEDIELLLALRKIEELWQKGFTGSITLHVGEDRCIKFETRTFERLARRSRAAGDKG